MPGAWKYIVPGTMGSLTAWLDVVVIDENIRTSPALNIKSAHSKHPLLSLWVEVRMYTAQRPALTA